MTATNRRQRARPPRMALATAAEPNRATWRSTTLVNSSKTTSSRFVSSARARSQRNFSPLDRTCHGRTHAGGLLKPTALSVAVMVRPSNSALKPSTTAASRGQSNPSTIQPLVIWPVWNAARAMVLLPEPDGPTIAPIRHGSPASVNASSSPGTSAENESLLRSAGGRSNKPAACCTRKLERIGLSTTTSIRGMSSPPVPGARKGAADRPRRCTRRATGRCRR